MKLTKKQMDVLLNAIAKEAAWYLRGSEILKVFEGSKNWSMVFEEDGETGVLFKALDSSLDMDALFHEAIRPYVAKQIAESLGAKKVTIEW